MLFSALVAAMVALPAPSVSPSVSPMAATLLGDPKIRVKLSDDELVAGDKAKVKVKAAQDGYLVVLRMDTEGRVRVIFPVDPNDDAHVRGGKEFEVRSRGDREAFTVAEHTGDGMVLAARSDRPFDFARFTTNSRWDLDALTPDSTARDPEAALLSIVDRMGGSGYDYDVVSYNVGTRSARRQYANRMYGAFGYGGWYDPWYASAFGGWPYYYGPRYGLGATYVRVVRVGRGHGRR